MIALARAPAQFWIAGLGLAALATILGALAMEIWGGLAPCPLCLQQRYAYYLAIPAAAVALALSRGEGTGMIAGLLLGLIALAFTLNAGLGAYHAGVEWGWWPGPQSCSGSNLGAVETGGDLLAALEGATVIRCDVAPWHFLGLSLAGYNVLISLALAGVAMIAAWRLWRGTEDME